MSTIHELGQAVRARRQEMGLTQAHIAAMSGLSRQTVNQVEAGSVPDLGFNKVDRLAAALGLSLRVETGSPPRTPRRTLEPLQRAAATASVSYRTSLSPARLQRIIASGEVPAAYAPHLHALLDDAHVSLLAAVARQLADDAGIDRKVTWKHYRSLARQVKSHRSLWQ